VADSELVVVSTGVANLASVLAGLRRAGAEPRLTRDPREVASARRVVLPGVGAFAPAMATLREHDLVGTLAERIRAGRATLAVCLGMQLLARESEEGRGETGLAGVEEKVTRCPNTVRVPQLGWNKVEPQDGCRFLKPGYAYFANSYKYSQPPSGWRAALTDHAGPFVAAMEHELVLTCQFHPELSGAWGAELLATWMKAT